MLCVFQQKNGAAQVASSAGTEGIAVTAADVAPLVERVAIYFANGQFGMVEHVLLAAMAHEEADIDPRVVWWMLFDLYQVTDQRVLFDRLSLRYADTMEISPPAWRDDHVKVQQATEKPLSAVVAFTQVTEAAQDKLAYVRTRIRQQISCELDFSTLVRMDGVGAAALLGVFVQSEQQGTALHIQGVDTLVVRSQALIQEGRADIDTAVWMLLFAVLRHTQQQAAYEALSLSYSVTYEISAPEYRVQRAEASVPDAASLAEKPQTGVFTMPAVLGGDMGVLLADLVGHAKEMRPLVIECGQWVLADFTNSGKFVGILMSLYQGDDSIRLVNLHYLVAALLCTMGVHRVARIAHPHN